MTKVEILYDTNAKLGEGPVWDSRTQTLYWVDILNKRIYANADVIAELDDFIGCLATRQRGGLVLTKRLSFWTFDLLTASSTFLAAPADEPVTNRFNDGKCDSRGRFLAGTMDLNETDPTGSLYSFDGKSITKLLSDVTISNGLTWSADGKTFYYIDTPTREVKAYDYDLESGAIANPRVAATIPASLGWPDGMTSDSQGNLWIAMWGGAQITKWNPHTGQLLEQIPVPALQPSSCAFGGKNMNELFITSARKGLDDAALTKYPLSGGVFRVETNVEGLPMFEFTG
ncbi:MAG TPA: SMP-30/gluconolactonase/LRE family protein [Anaerolineales bacterium]|nr:SMP-30/gluconolactonase/LRE family protein [Anaerolineales bacterium]HMS00310.1 SMP-30/gluconolactonase/LRE family protein [Anaerolineales bacterium]HNQ95071.1 SMP-30/gluconolactonase/LRE family protein [Anaerolineales bacterium]HNS61547.1 SMP-30/gluconolactonase/LRE family protein [Anaerolineales bacterium]